MRTTDQSVRVATDPAVRIANNPAVRIAPNRSVRIAPNRSVRIANCSGFYGDRLSAAKEMVDGGQIDVLTGDWLAELTMLILAKTQSKGGPGYARTFVTQMEQVMQTCLERGIKVVANAGGLDPQGCAEAVQQVASKLGLNPRIAYVSGDNLAPRFDDMRASGIPFTNLDTGKPLGDQPVVSANVYLGGWGIAEALDAGADIVITGRVTDAAVVLGPAAWFHGWARDDWDALAGAVVAGHVIECGCQATGGNYSFFQEIPGLERPGFPIAEIAANGSSVITKHEGTGGAVTVGTVTAQVLYEIGSSQYANPDVVARFDTIQLSQEGPDRVLISGVTGEPAPAMLKVAINYEGGFRNRFTFCITGLDIEAKADLIERTFWAQLPGGKDGLAFAQARLIRTDHVDSNSNEAATALLRFTVKDADERKIGRAFSNVAIEMALASYPGMFGMGGPSAAEPYGIYWPSLIPVESVTHTVSFEGSSWEVVPASVAHDSPLPPPLAPVQASTLVTSGETTRLPLGRLVGARSGDKGGNANVGLWAKSDAVFEWLSNTLTVEVLKQLLPEAADLPVQRYDLPNIRALNFVIVGLLEEGVAASSRFDPQAKGLGEWLRSRHVDAPVDLLA
jgi:Acyclic terpene utilisation family protein AtuA